MGFANFLIILIVIFSSINAETILKPKEVELNYNIDFKGYVTKTTYKDCEKIVYSIFTVESGPNIGVQLFCIPNSKNLTKLLPDSFIEDDGVVYYVYDYVDYWVFHNVNNEILILF